MEAAAEAEITASSGATNSDAPPLAVHRIFPIEMINPNPSPTWRTAFGLS